MTHRNAAAAIGPALLFTLLPLAGAFALLLLSWALGVAEGAGRPIALALGWCLAVFGTIRMLKSHWTGFAGQPTWSLVCAAGCAFSVALVLARLAEPWNDLMSQPKPTPTMVALDLFANLGPLAIGTVCAWVVLVLAQRQV